VKTQTDKNCISSKNIKFSISSINQKYTKSDIREGNMMSTFLLLQANDHVYMNIKTTILKILTEMIEKLKRTTTYFTNKTSMVFWSIRKLAVSSNMQTYTDEFYSVILI